MKGEILSRIYAYKHDGNYLQNFRELISIIRDVSENIDKPGMLDIGIHLVFESRNHRWGMCYSKAFEMANELQNEIMIETENLITALPEDLKPALSFMNTELTMYKSQLVKNPYDSWIMIAVPWVFFILETVDSARLFINNYDNNLKEEIPTNDFFNFELKNENKSPFELIYSTINEWMKNRWLIESAKN